MSRRRPSEARRSRHRLWTGDAQIGIQRNKIRVEQSVTDRLDHVRINRDQWTLVLVRLKVNKLSITGRRNLTLCPNLAIILFEGRMKLLALGATGRTGRWVLEYALGAGDDVVALARTPEKILARSPKLSVVRGTPENADDGLPAIRGCEAVISTLDNSRASDLPWARPVSPPMLMTGSIRNALAAMRRSGARRIVVLSALGVGDSF